MLALVNDAEGALRMVFMNFAPNRAVEGDEALAKLEDCSAASGVALTMTGDRVSGGLSFGISGLLGSVAGIWKSAFSSGSSYVSSPGGPATGCATRVRDGCTSGESDGATVGGNGGVGGGGGCTPRVTRSISSAW